MSESVKTEGAARPGGWSRIRWVAAGLVGGLLAGGASVWAVSADDFRGGFMGRRFMHRLHGGRSADPEAAREHVKMGVKWVLGYVDATPEQEQKVQAIAQDALGDLLPLRESHHANRKAIHDALAGATIDREALEQARRAEIKLADQASARLAQAVVDAADVLTPEQRTKLAEAAHRFHR
jgi:Spy/CpxP family protein refolding chaperone